MREHSIPLLEFDPGREAVIEPEKAIRYRDLPERCVMCFFKEVIDRTKDKDGWKPLHPVKSEMGELPVFTASYHGQELCMVPAAVGAPLAAGFLEVLIARGGRKFLVCGSAAVLDKTIDCGHIVVPTSALRDEGTSYHYLPPESEARPAQEALDAITRVLERHGCSYLKGKTWTTDAFYRETPGKVERRRNQGCLTVEMEAAALFSVAEFRGVKLGQLLYGADDVSGGEWDIRGFGKKLSARETLFWLAVEACVEME